MNIDFFHTDEVPQPKDQIRIESLKALPYPDRRRIFVEIKVTPFQERPNLILVLHDDSDKMVGELTIIETMHSNMEFTVHLRGMEDTTGSYTVSAELFYETRTPPQDRKVEGFVVPPEETNT